MEHLDPFADPTIAHRYADKVALVTGAASGIGRATAIRLAAEGASVYCADVNAEGVAETEAHITAAGGTARSSTADITDPAACTALVDATIEAFGGLDVLCNIAGIGGMRHFGDESLDRLNAMLAVNMTGPFLLIQAALPHLQARTGNVVNLASTAGVIGQAYCAAYCASKHAIVGLTKSLALEFGRTGLRFNAVCPGGVNTGLIANFLPPEGASGSLIARQFLNRDMQEPESVAAMVAYVGSDECYYLNGAVLTLDGGTSVG
jgi:meso-butanediol dehydrogenase/(S,S)-butanediol dehydrogenase/diacetyl reductase